MLDNNENKFNKVKYDNDFQKNNYDRINFLVKKGKKEELKIHCGKFGYKSVNDFIKQAVNEKIERDLDQM